MVRDKWPLRSGKMLHNHPQPLASSKRTGEYGRTVAEQQSGCFRMSKIDYHYQTMGRILSHLVQQGLKRVDFDDSDAMKIMTERHGDEEEVLQTFADVLHWMNDEGLIRS